MQRVILSVCEESSRRKYAVIVLSSVGYEEMLHYVQHDKLSIGFMW